MSTELLKAALLNFLADYWWLILMVVFGGGYSVLMYKRAKASRRAPTVKPRTAGAEYAFSVDELRPFFGTYRWSSRDLMEYGGSAAVFIIWGVILASDKSPDPVLIGGAALVLIAICAAAALDAASQRIIGPDAIRYLSPFRVLSWSIPLSEVRQCELASSLLRKRLIVVTAGSRRSLPLTSALSKKLYEATRVHQIAG